MKNARLSFAQGPWITRLPLGVCSAWLILAAFGLLRAGESQPLPASLGAKQTVYLEYRELSNGSMTWNLPLSTQSASFKKEPALGSRKVVRGTLNLGSSADQFIPFIWDQTKGKLYLDLNRNRDLTDDAGGVFTCSGRFGFANNYQTFTNVHLSFKAAGGTHPALVDVNLYDYNQVQGNLVTRSYWAGKASLQGREWQLGVVEDIGSNPGLAERGYLLLRPWAERDKPFELQDGSLDGFQFCRNLFFNGQAYHLDCAYVQQGDAPRYKVDLEKRQADLGEIKLTGKFIKRIALHGSKFTVVMDQPEPVLKVPVGSYGPCQVQLKAGRAEAFREVARFAGMQSGNATTVSATKADRARGGRPVDQHRGRKPPRKIPEPELPAARGGRRALSVAGRPLPA